MVYANRYKFFSAGAIGTFMATLDGSILNVALPTISEDFNTDINIVAWVVLAYSLTLISLMLAFGAWTQRRGYRFAYRFGYSFFIIGSALCAMSPQIYVLIAARVVQAIGTAMFAATGPGMITTVFPAKERGKGIGLMVMMVSAGFMVGPPLGGYLLGIWGWHSIFLINIPIGIVGLGVVQKYFGILKKPENQKPVVWTTAMAVSVGLVSGIFALSSIDDYQLTDPRLWGMALVSLISLAIYVRLESKPNRRLIGLDIFKNFQFSTSIGAQLMHFISISGVLVLLPFYLERVKNLEPKQVGLYLVILPIMMFLFAPLSGRLSDKIGYRFLTGMGMFLLGFGLWLLSGITIETEMSYVVICLMVVGAGVGIFSTPNASALMGSVTESQRAVVSGILATNRNLGMSLGVALSTALFAYLQVNNASLGNDDLIFIESYRSVIFIGISFSFLGIIFCMLRANKYTDSEIKTNPVESG